MSSIARRGFFRKDSIHTLESTSSTGSLFARLGISPHLLERAVPEPGPRELEDLTGSRAADVVFEGAVDRAGIGSFAADPGGFLQQFLIQHKICTFHVSSMTPLEVRRQRGEQPPRPAALVGKASAKIAHQQSRPAAHSPRWRCDPDGRLALLPGERQDLVRGHPDGGPAAQARDEGPAARRTSRFYGFHDLQ